MARTVTAGQRTAIASAHPAHACKLEIEDPDGTYQNMGTLGGDDWVLSVRIEEGIDGHGLTMSAELARDSGAGTPLESLAPLREDSTLNRDSLAAYAPFLDVGRKWRLSVSVVEYADRASPVYEYVGEGLLDTVSVRGMPATIAITGRDLGASMLDRWIDTERTYSAGGADSMETVIQALLTDNLTSAPTLYVPVSPAFTMNKWQQQKEPLMTAINKVAQLAGMVVRYRYDSADAYRLTLYEPNRTIAPGSEHWTLAATEYTQIPAADMSILGVRNRILIQYHDASTELLTTHTESDATSIARYGGPHAIPRVMEIDLAADTNINTAARVNALAEDILSDLKNPDVQYQVIAPGFWPAQLGDYFKLTADGVLSDQVQYAAATQIALVYANGKLTATMGMRGQPAGRYRGWGHLTSVTPPNPLALNVRAKIFSTTATQVVIRVAVADPLVRAGPNVSRIFGGSQGPITVTFTVVGATLVTASPLSIANAVITNDIDTTGTVDITVTRAAFEAGMGRVTITATRRGRASGTDSVDVPSQDGPGPNFDVNGAAGATVYTITWTAGSGTTLTYSTDSGAFGNLPASPFTVSRNSAGGADKVLTFKGTRNGQTVTDQITIPAQDATLSPPIVSNVRVTGVNNVSDEITVAWDSTNIGSYTMNLAWSLGGAFFGSGSVTTITGVTSPYVHNDTGTGGHGLDLTSGGTLENIYYKVTVTSGANTLAESEPIAYQTDHV